MADVSPHQLPYEPPFGSTWSFNKPSNVVWIALAPIEAGSRKWNFLAIGRDNDYFTVVTMMWRHVYGGTYLDWHPDPDPECFP